MLGAAGDTVGTHHAVTSRPVGFLCSLETVHSPASPHRAGGSLGMQALMLLESC